MTENPNNVPMFARAILGWKKTEKAEARISYELKEDSRRKWMDDGFSSESEYIDFLMSVDVYGKDHVRSLIERRFSRVFSLSDKGRANDGEASQ